ncbi:Hypothetical Protein NTJ_04262 [Nesidiocoris tenuis]|uniref:Exuperantia SAM-like domain-containing protein n=1 Tax=Nesidiocoris tenuis TaxID=355587 RepID=A0ABN7AJU8_9HEMI|nr:Hypothetical Protein NTJ_04262 [Nesidiocoris tenuis]
MAESKNETIQPSGDRLLYVSWDVDTTGRRLLDDICNVGAFCNEFSMQQYIMPYKDIMLPMRRRHNLATINIGFYRVLKETISGKIVKTKSELFGLLDFIMKLEAQKNDRGIILMCYERQKLAPYLLIEGLKRYDLLDRFKAVVKGFANCYDFIKVHCATTMVAYSLKTLAKILLDSEPKNLHDAFQRAKLVHEIVVHLSTGESNDPIKDLAVKMAPYVQTFDEIENELEQYKVMLNRQRTLKPIFGQMIKTPAERRKAIRLRQYLTEANIDFECLNSIVSEEANITEYLHSRIAKELPENDLADLSLVVTNHFAPSENSEPTENVKPPKKPASKDREYRKREKNNKGSKPKNAENGLKGDKTEVSNVNGSEKNESHEEGGQDSQTPQTSSPTQEASSTSDDSIEASKSSDANSETLSNKADKNQSKKIEAPPSDVKC